MRTGAGAPLVDNAKFSDLRALVARVHAIGVKVGWYVNTCWCNDQEHRVWPRGNVRADAELVLKQRAKSPLRDPRIVALRALAGADAENEAPIAAPAATAPGPRTRSSTGSSLRPPRLREADH